MLVEMNQIQKTGTTVIRKGIRFNVLENEIPEQLKDLKKVFKEISERELLSHRDGVDYEITIKTEKIKSLLLISTRSEKQKIIKEYLDEMTKKE